MSTRAGDSGYLAASPLAGGFGDAGYDCGAEVLLQSALGMLGCHKQKDGCLQYLFVFKLQSLLFTLKWEKVHSCTILITITFNLWDVKVMYNY